MVKIISGFPGIGKSYFAENSGLKVADSDSSKFDKANFPQNYIDHIKEIQDDYDIILVSSHKEVRDALVENDMDFILVYPFEYCKKEYLNRYRERGSSEEFIDLLGTNFTTWIKQLDNQDCYWRYRLHSQQYLSDIIDEIKRAPWKLKPIIF